MSELSFTEYLKVLDCHGRRYGDVIRNNNGGYNTRTGEQLTESEVKAHIREYKKLQNELM